MDSTTSRPATKPTESRWILVVDDEASMLPLLSAVLESHGMPIREARNGDDAIAIVEAAPTPPALLVCDVMMPGVDGMELTRRLLQRVPRLKVIFISAHLTDVSWWPEDLRDHRFVAKPFSLKELGTAVTEVLEEADSLG
jgi:CheY-like chemotaxis protein